MCQEWKRVNISCKTCGVRLCKTCQWIYKKDIYCQDCGLEIDITLKDVVDSVKTQINEFNKDKW